MPRRLTGFGTTQTLLHKILEGWSEGIGYAVRTMCVAMAASKLRSTAIAKSLASELSQTIISTKDVQMAVEAECSSHLLKLPFLDQTGRPIWSPSRKLVLNIFIHFCKEVPTPVSTSGRMVSAVTLG